jgi:hypothetical protein
MDSIGTSGFGGSNLAGLGDNAPAGAARVLSLNFSYDPAQAPTLVDHITAQAAILASLKAPGGGQLNLAALEGNITNSLAGGSLGPSIAAIFQVPLPQTDAASQASDLEEEIKRLFQELVSRGETIQLDEQIVLAIGERLKNLDPATVGDFYGPFAVTSYQYSRFASEAQEAQGGLGNEANALFHGEYPIYLRLQNGQFVSIFDH